MIAHGKMKPLSERIADLAHRGDRAGLSDLFSEYHNADISLALRQCPVRIQETALLSLSPERAGRVLFNLNPHHAARIMNGMEPRDLAEVLGRLEQDMAADLFARIKDPLEQKALDLLPVHQSRDLAELIEYDPESAGGIMTKEFIALDQDLTIQQAIEKLREKYSPDSPMHVYVIDGEGKLAGYLPLKRLIVNAPGKKLRDVTIKTIAALNVRMDREEVAGIALKYDLFFLPVVDEEGRMVGVVSLDDVLDAVQEEASEDLLISAGTDPVELAGRGVFIAVKARMPWLLASWFGGVSALFVLARFQSSLEAMVSLAAFIPVIMGLGGNAGNQTATVLIRELALGHTRLGDAGMVLFKELRVGLSLGAFFGVLLGLVAKFGFNDGDHYAMLGAVVGLSILSAIVLGVLVGSAFPLLLKKLNVDPAIATAPFVATTMDIGGLSLYFLLAKLLLPI